MSFKAAISFNIGLKWFNNAFLFDVTRVQAATCISYILPCTMHAHGIAPIILYTILLNISIRYPIQTFADLRLRHDSG